MNYEIRRSPRSCSVCDSTNSEFLWEYESVSKQRTKKWLFKVSHSICKDCGFSYLSPCYLSEDLRAYYEDSYTYYKPDFSAEKRLKFLERNNIVSGDFAEIGANTRNEFHQSLETIFDSITLQDINQTGQTDYSDLEAEHSKQFDVIGHYFVLEHISDPAQFLIECFNLLKDDGLMIIEVPDLQKYDTHFLPLEFHEHTNHFTVKTLERLCHKLGFKLLDHDGDLCSRNFGFVALFQKQKGRLDQIEFTNQYSDNLKKFEIGKSNAISYNTYLQSILTRMNHDIENGKSILVWGANMITRSLIALGNWPEGVRIVDSDVNKSDYLSDLNAEVFLPKEEGVDLSSFDVLVICSGLNYLEEILLYIKQEFGKEFPKDSLILASSQNQK